MRGDKRGRDKGGKVQASVSLVTFLNFSETRSRWQQKCRLRIKYGK